MLCERSRHTAAPAWEYTMALAIHAYTHSDVSAFEFSKLQLSRTHHYCTSYTTIPVRNNGSIYYSRYSYRFVTYTDRVHASLNGRRTCGAVIGALPRHILTAHIEMPVHVDVQRIRILPYLSDTNVTTTCCNIHFYFADMIPYAACDQDQFHTATVFEWNSHKL